MVSPAEPAASREPDPPAGPSLPSARRPPRALGSWWGAAADRRVVGGLLLVWLFFWLLVFPASRVDHQLRNPADLVALQRASDPVTFAAALDSWLAPATPPRVSAYRWELLGADIWFAALTGALLSAVVAYLTRGARRSLFAGRHDASAKERRWARVAAILVVLPWAAIPFDWLENVLQVLVLAAYDPAGGPGAWAAAVDGRLTLAASVCSDLKWLLLAVPLLTALALRRTRPWSDSGPGAEGTAEGSGAVEAQGATAEPPLYTRTAAVVHDAEAQAVRRRRRNALTMMERRGPPVPSEVRSALEAPPNPSPIRAVGLAFSGGGIRSACFNLGVLQGLSRLGVLPFVDYLASVSGGGFPAANMTALLSAPPRGEGADFGFDTTWARFPYNPALVAWGEKADGKPTAPDPDCETQRQAPESGDFVPCLEYRGGVRNRQLTYLRNMGSYLAPRLSAASRDTLRGVGAIAGGFGYTATLYILLFAAVASFWYLAFAALSSHVFIKGLQASFLAAARDAILVGGHPPWAAYAVSFLIGMAVAVVAAWRTRVRYQPSEPRPEAPRPATDGRGQRELRDDETLLMYGFALAGAAVAVVGVTGLMPRACCGGWAVDVPAAAWLPFVMTLGALLGLGLYRLNVPVIERPEVWSDPEFRSIIWSFQGFTLYAAIGAALFALLSLTHYYRVGPGAPGRPLNLALLASAGSTLLALLEARSDRMGSTVQRLLGATVSLRRLLLGALLVTVIIATLLFFTTLIDTLVRSLGWNIPQAVWFLVWLAGGASILFYAFGRRVNLNYLSPHYFTRDRIADTFLRTEVEAPDGTVSVAWDRRTLLLSCVNHPESSAPYHLVMGSLNLSGSRHLRHKDRRAEPFLFSREYCGAPITGYVRTSAYGHGDTKYARALAISGAAVSSGVGHMTFFAQAFVLTLLNLRLGLWIPNPRGYCSTDPVGNDCDELGLGRRNCFDEAEHTAFWPSYLFQEMRGRFTDRLKLVNVTDGAHTGDNASLYPLFERRCRVIVAGDASGDPEYRFTDLYRVIRQVKTDFDIDVEIDVTGLTPEGDSQGPLGRRFSGRHHAVGRITYPPLEPGGAPQVGWLIYLKPTVSGADPARLRQYLLTHKEFPLPSTADQFFDEYQYEAQRLLGEVAVASCFGPEPEHDTPWADPFGEERLQRMERAAGPRPTASRSLGRRGTRRRTPAPDKPPPA